jgi:CBS domain-containing protein
MPEPLARDIMAQDVIYVRPDTPLRMIAELLIDQEISGVPVLDDQRRVVGMVSETDLIDEEKRKVPLPRSLLFGTHTLPQEVFQEVAEEANRLTAADVMTRRVFSLPETATVRELAEEMVSRKINRVPIVRDEQLVGLVTRADVLGAIRHDWRG